MKGVSGKSLGCHAVSPSGVSTWRERDTLGMASSATYMMITTFWDQQLRRRRPKTKEILAQRRFFKVMGADVEGRRWITGLCNVYRKRELSRLDTYEK